MSILSRNLDLNKLEDRYELLYKSFASLAHSLFTLGCDGVLDGEIVVLDGEDLRPKPFIERKEMLRRIISEHPAILYAQHVEAMGVKLFEHVCEQDLEGIVCKRKDAAYGEHWYKVRNPRYSQYEGRHELFEKRGRFAAGQGHTANSVSLLRECPKLHQ